MASSPDKSGFIQFLMASGALQFGRFTLKSGRISPYFFNTACFDTGLRLKTLGGYFAQAAAQLAPQATIVFGPAYKGIPLALATAQAMSETLGRDVAWLFDRKEAKTHGDTGLWVGRQPQPGDRLVLVDDVLTDGATKRQAVAMLRQTFGAPIDGLVVAFNRMEKDGQGQDAMAAFTQETGVPVAAVASLDDVEALLAQGALRMEGALRTEGAERSGLLAELREYRAQYGL